MKLALTVIQIIISISLAGLILLQAKGVGLGRTFGGASFHSKRGVESIVFKATVVLSFLFVVLAIVNQLVI